LRWTLTIYSPPVSRRTGNYRDIGGSCWSILQTEGCESSTPKRSLISLAIRGSVHSSVAKPAAIAPAHGTEFTSVALEEWTYRRGVKLDFTRPGKPTDVAPICGRFGFRVLLLLALVPFLYSPALDS
jgi:transposase InsO family protein